MVGSEGGNRVGKRAARAEGLRSRFVEVVEKVGDVARLIKFSGDLGALVLVSPWSSESSSAKESMLSRSSSISSFATEALSSSSISLASCSILCLFSLSSFSASTLTPNPSPTS